MTRSSGRFGDIWTRFARGTHAQASLSDKKASPMKAGILAAPVVAIVGVVVMLTAAYAVSAVSEAIILEVTGRHGSQLEFPFSTIANSMWVVGLGIGITAAVVANFVILVNYFPFGRYRLRLVLKDDPTSEVFS